MRITFFSTQGFERKPFEKASEAFRHSLHFLEARLTGETCALAAGSEAVCVFVCDRVDAAVLQSLQRSGTRVLLLRSAGFDHVDMIAAAQLELPVLRVPAYSPHAVAEHAFALLLGLIRRIPRAHARVRDGNFSLDKLVGFELCAKTFGVIGTGRIGRAAATIARGFGCRVIAYDVRPDEELARELGVRYVSLDELLAESDIVSLHAPLTPQSRHIIDAAGLRKMKPSCILINTSRGALIDTAALVEALKAGRLGGAALDVYEGEGGLFFRDRSGEVIADELLMWLNSLHNVLITAHQGFLTDEALEQIAATTLANATDFESGGALLNRVVLGSPDPPKV
jgi:D-lactate dehydrogenase